MLDLFINFLKGLVSMECSITDWIMAIAAFGALIVAISANNTWRREIRAKKLFELNSQAYSLIERIEAKIEELQREVFIPEEYGDNFMGDFFRDFKESNVLNKLFEDSKRIKQKTIYIEYFKNIINSYSEMLSDNPISYFHQHNPETEELEEDCYINGFWSEYIRQEKDDKYSDFRLKFDKKIKDSKEFYDKEIIKFYKS